MTELSNLLNVIPNPHQQIRFYLDQLPAGYRELALNHNGANLDDKAWNIAEAVSLFATWYHTNEGVSFWSGVRGHYLDGTLLPPLPSANATKSIRRYLQYLPDAYRVLALKYPSPKFEDEVSSMAIALTIFVLSDITEEGEEFWGAVMMHYKTGTPLPPLPGTTIPHAYYHKAEDVEKILELPNGVYEITVTDNGVSISAKQTDK